MSHFNVSLTVAGKVIRQCPPTLTFRDKDELKWIWSGSHSCPKVTFSESWQRSFKKQAPFDENCYNPFRDSQGRRKAAVAGEP